MGAKWPNDIVEDIVANQLYDEESGDVESPTGWFCISGNLVIVEDNYGFVSQHSFHDDGYARQYFEELQDYYCRWSVNNE